MKVSVLTPTLNRGNYLPNVFKGIRELAHGSFEVEWIIGDDGSVDNTKSVVQLLSAENSSGITIKYFRSSVRVGKATIDNKLIGLAGGDYLMWCDSDDKLISSNLRYLNLKYVSDKNFLGIVGECVTNLEPRDTQNLIPSSTYSEMTLGDACKQTSSNDKCFIFRSEVIKCFSFPEVDYYVPESCIWSRLQDMTVCYTHADLLHKNYLRDGSSISFVPKIQYPRGYLYADLIRLSSTPYKEKAGNNFKFFDFVNCARYSLLSLTLVSYTLHTIMQINGPLRSYLIYLCGFCLCLKDCIMKNTEYNYSKFQLSRAFVYFEYLTFN